MHSDLISVAVTSRHFHKLASTVLYRNFHIIFPDEDDPDFDLPKDGLAGGLDTFATSDYNYAAHLKDLSMETVSTGFKAEVSYQPYLYSASCGKFLNSLLHLTIKRAKALEVFRFVDPDSLISSRQVAKPSLQMEHSCRTQQGCLSGAPPSILAQVFAYPAAGRRFILRTASAFTSLWRPQSRCPR